jgi:hypothetical protein
MQRVMERAKRSRSTASRHAGRGLPTCCERDHDAGRPRENVSVSCADETKALTQVGAILSRSEVHVVPPFRESPRATGVIEKASATRLAPLSGAPWVCEPASQRGCVLRRGRAYAGAVIRLARATAPLPSRRVTARSARWMRAARDSHRRCGPLRSKGHAYFVWIMPNVCDDMQPPAHHEEARLRQWRRLGE